ncbi:hypothetical protein NL532_24000 [Mesorhizobium sp. C120A]|uniref:hypothetical protein n=1 Tax=unclassified Mesorhizobium TaxID=325217 RepID=UPI0012DE81DA|nr:MULTISPECIES: hypothetical protein [unclassified Mesorhizobium]WJI43672.1 hypothetical protein NL532_24000 [Mesorhizobium sp. C120A]
MNSSLGGGSGSPSGTNSGLGGPTSNNSGNTVSSGGVNASGNRASGAGPMSSSNTTTTGAGYGGTPAKHGATAAQARASETKSMNDMADWGKEVKGVVAAGPGWTSVELNNGQVETRKGDRASRNNNPGNIEAGDFAKKAGAVGTDGRFAVFSSKEDGLKAIGALLGTSRYANKTIEGAIGSYAPPNENNTASYAATVAGKIGVSKDTPMSSLTAAQRDAMARAISGVEGNTGYSVTSTTGVDRFSSTYMGGVSASPTSKSTATPSGRPAQQNDPSSLAPGTYRGYDPSGLPAETPVSTPVPNARPNTRPDPVSVVSGKPTTAPVSGQFPGRPRSLGEKIAAGAIDLGLGSLPGIGMAAGVINGGLALTGNSTLGEHIVDSFVTGKGAGAGPDSGANRPGTGGGQVVKDKTTVPKQTESFEDKYIKFVDPTVRPTPGQRWDYNTSGYS